MLFQEKNNKDPKSKAVVMAAFLLALAVLYLLAGIFFGFYIPCPFRAVTGLRCPGCGLSHAATDLAFSIAALFRGDLQMAQICIKNAFSDNLLFPLFYAYIIMASYIGFRREVLHEQNPHVLAGKAVDILNCIMLLIVLVWWAARNMLGY